jgi:hypothetical protein
MKGVQPEHSVYLNARYAERKSEVWRLALAPRCTGAGAARLLQPQPPRRRRVPQGGIGEVQVGREVGKGIPHEGRRGEARLYGYATR